MKVLISGKDGQLGYELQKTLPADTECLACDKRELDVTSTDSINSVVSSYSPDIVINAAAYTAVDKAEKEKQQAFLVNATGVKNILSVIKSRQIKLLHLSTDFVFSGNSTLPYLPSSPVDPIGVYGASKAEAEKIVREEYPENSLIIRTSWLYSAHGHNFVKTMLRLMQKRDALNVVSDQTGTPTWAGGLAGAIWRFCRLQDITGIFHWSDDGVTTWYDFACAIQEEALRIGLLDRAIPVHPITTADYPTTAKRPMYSVLDKQSTWDIIGYRSPDWRVCLQQMLTEYKSSL